MQIDAISGYEPSSVLDAVEFLHRGLEPEDIATIRRTSSADSHFGLGMYLRNTWIHGRDEPSALVRSCLETYGVSMADDVSGLILGGLWARVNGTPFDFQAEADKYKAHWIEAGCDPATGERRNA